MAIRSVSDLHLESNASIAHPLVIPALPTDKDDILVLAGDICSMWTRTLPVAKAFFANVCGRFKHVLYVFGNHEFYKSGLLTAPVIFQEEIGKHFDNLTFTTNGTTFHDGDIKFIMATLWTAWDHPQEALFISNEHSMVHCKKQMGDFFLIKDEEDELFTPQKSKEIHQKHFAFIKHELEATDYKTAVVITHHAPSLKSLHPKYWRDPLNPAFSSNLSRFWSEYKPSLMIHGHCHNNFDYMENPYTRVVCNPLGYGGENPNFSPYLRIEFEL